MLAIMSHTGLFYGNLCPHGSPHSRSQVEEWMVAGCWLCGDLCPHGSPHSRSQVEEWMVAGDAGCAGISSHHPLLNLHEVPKALRPVKGARAPWKKSGMTHNRKHRRPV